MIFSILYDICLFLLFLLALPKMFYQMVVHGKYRSSFARRLGFRLPSIEKGDKPLYWIHAVSVGETKAVASLAKLIKDKHPQAILIISTITETGQAEAQRSLPFADHHLYLPFDFSFCIGSILHKIRPDYVILCETDFWYHFLRFSKLLGAKIALVNGKMSERSAGRLKKFSFFSHRIFNLIDLFCVQNAVYANRFLSAGVSANKIVIGGNLKFDQKYGTMTIEEAEQFKKQLGFGPSCRVVVLASTHSPEEELILSKLSDEWLQSHHFKLIIVPRHPERFDEVEHLLRDQKRCYVRYSALKIAPQVADIVLLDTMGMLLKCYQIADVAVVCGSFTEKVGGHNILEPCAYGIPVLFGPYMYGQPELRELVLSHGAGRQIDLEKLKETLEALLSNEELRKEIGKKGLELINEMKGTTARTYEFLNQKGFG